jgi:homoserine O-acetyltransferase
LSEWLDERQEWFLNHGPDPVDWLCQTRAYDAHDVGATQGFSGDVAAALQSIRARTLVIAPPLDLYNPSQAARDAAHWIPNATFLEIPSALGHRCTSGENVNDSLFLNRVIRDFLGDCFG